MNAISSAEAAMSETNGVEDGIIVKGILRDTGAPAMVRFTVADRCGKPVWQQRALSESAKHLNRDYVCCETIEEIEHTWFRHDWKVYEWVVQMEDAIDVDITNHSNIVYTNLQ